jgi:type VI protein secretion system component VasK
MLVSLLATMPAAPAVIPATAPEGVLDYRSTEFLLLALGVVMTIVAFAVGIWLYRAALREHRAQLEAERRERVAQAEKERGA